MQETTVSKLQIAYEGPALRGGRMPMLALAAGLRGQALLIERAKDILYGESLGIRVEVDSEFESSSLIVPVHILADIRQAEQLLSGPMATALSNLLAILGFIGGGTLTLYKLFKRLKGRRIEKVEDIPTQWEILITVELVIRLYNDPEIQAQLRRTLDPLHQDGIVEFQTRRDGVTIETISRNDLAAADEAEIADLTKDDEVELDIEKSAWKRDLSWHFSDGRVSFDARIEDDAFWRRIDGGEAFAEGDRLRVHLRTIAHRTPQGRLKIERVIPTVIEVDHVRNRQTEMFGGEVEQP